MTAHVYRAEVTVRFAVWNRITDAAGLPAEARAPVRNPTHATFRRTVRDTQVPNVTAPSATYPQSSRPAAVQRAVSGR
jgi:hypothetical protein